MCPYVFDQSSADKLLILESKCWSRSSTPSPGKCLITGMTWFSSKPFRCACAIRRTRLGSEPNVRVFVIGLRKLLSISTIGAKDMLQPT